MQRKWVCYLKPLTALPAILMLVMIYVFSAQTGDKSAEISGGLVQWTVEGVNRLLHLEMSEKEIETCIDNLQHPVRKAAHMTEYFILTLLVMLPLWVYKVRGRRLLLISFAICVAAACSDELHQMFVAERGPAIKDVGIDSIGITFAVLLAGFLERKRCVYGTKKDEDCADWKPLHRR